MEFYRMQADILPKVHFVGETEIKPPYVHKRRRAGEYIIYLIKSGEMYLKEGNVSLTLSPGDFCILDKDRTHVGIKPSCCSYYYIHFTHEAFYRVLDDREEIPGRLLMGRQKSVNSNIYDYAECNDPVLWLPKYWHIADASALAQISGLLRQAVSENVHPLENYKMLCACKILEALFTLSRCYVTSLRENGAGKQTPCCGRVQEMMEWLNREYAREISSSVIEEEFCGNFDYMNRSFKKVTGQTIFQYLTNVRINRARFLILHTPMRMYEVCERVGYPDVYYFSRVFKKTVGVSPAAFLRTATADGFEEKEKVAIG